MSPLAQTSHRLPKHATFHLALKIVLHLLNSTQAETGTSVVFTSGAVTTTFTPTLFCRYAAMILSVALETWPLIICGHFDFYPMIRPLNFSDSHSRTESISIEHQFT
ncbi:hypothetical protein PoB_002408500 [Plakobranchus ocellatus]|uniref:Uncharacterized protein n=1 Tax=Plakobranchus ocellatus TaxID=259542 RepID=A0AAV3ZPC9_9GAST|nr:hypothetical protein PoB_002408500 [Plakobranchus ocellatus]